MPIGLGTIVGPYRITALVGEGGMGTVWRAHHMTLKRDDALKVLPDSFVADPARVERFQREAQVLASLNHPNIAHVHGLEHAEGAHALVMELVEGPTLADLVARGPLPWDEALAIARQIADALEAAHQQRIIHRDLKPANVKVRPDGLVKVLDFGLAKIAEHGSTDSASLSMSPTTPALTHAGFIVGTPAYISPEQARGKPVDERADIWAFGCVLFEMVSGRPVFAADDASLTLARVLEREPALDRLPTTLPSQVRRAIALCLNKDPRQRISDIRDVRLMLDGAFDAGDAATAGPGALPPVWHRARWWLASAVVGAALGAFAVVTLRPAGDARSPRVVRFSFAAPESVAPRGGGTGRHVLALSPTGTHLVYWANEQLHVRALDRLGQDAVLRGTEGSREPFFSPDGKWIGFGVSGQLRRVSIDGGVPVSLGSTGALWGARWHPDGIIYYGRGPEGIWALPAAGGEPSQLVKVAEGELAHGPQLLPGGDWLLFTLRRAKTESWDQAQIVAESIRTGEQRVLVHRGRDARYVPTGHLVYGLDGSLLAVPFDAVETRVTGEPIPLVEGVVDADVRTGAMHFSLSDDGSLVYLAGGSGQRSSLAWITRAGSQQPLPAPSRSYGGPRVSPDGTSAAVDVERDGNVDVLVYDFARNVLTPLASSPAREQFPTWTRDGRRVVFYSDANGGGLYWKLADGTGATERLTTNASLQLPSSSSADGRTLVFHQTVRAAFANIRPTDPSDLYTVSLDQGHAVTALATTPVFESQPTLSPDATWLAYSAIDAGRQNVYVRPFPNVEEGRWQISTDGGGSPLWSPDGKWLYYISERTAFAVPVETRPTFRPGSATALFDLPPIYSSAAASGWRMWDVAPDGQRFLIVVPGGLGQTEIVVVLHWTEELKRLVPSVAR